VSYYPVFLDLRGRRCVVAGGGPAAAQKARGLLEAGARVDVYAPRPCPELAALDVTVVRREYRQGDMAGARLAIDASGSADVAAAMRHDADAEGTLLNVMDVPEHCDFIAPAIVKRGPLQVAISTSGESPFLAASLRARLQRELGDEWREFVTLVGELRRGLRRQGVPLDRQTRIYQRLLASNVLDLLRAGAVAAARHEAERIVHEASSLERNSS
jgi:siroheme synthase-like protein